MTNTDPVTNEMIPTPDAAQTALRKIVDNGRAGNWTLPSSFILCAEAGLAASQESDTVVVPKSALNWLFGSGPDANGKTFADARPDFTDRPHPAYWWRSHLRKLIGQSQRYDKVKRTIVSDLAATSSEGTTTALADALEETSATPSHFQRLIELLDDWRNADHEDNIVMTRSNVCYLLDGIKALRPSKAFSEGERS